MSVHVTSVIEIYDTDGPASIYVGDYEIPGVIQVFTKDEKDTNYFGKIDFTLNVDNAEAVAHALLKKVAEIRAAGNA